MGSHMRPAFLLLCIGVSFVSSAFVLPPPHMWTKLILTHHWPNTFCTMEHCHPNISYWTLHGLWPDKGVNCNHSWHFNATLIGDLMQDMEKSWPDLLKPLSTTFWKYEWQKHGTCAARAADLNSQHKYFSKALELYHKVNLDSVLKKFNITPSEEYYSFPAIEAAIENFYGVMPKIQCDHEPEGFQILGQIEICFDPEFALHSCEKETVEESVGAAQAPGFSVCDHDVPVYYPPLPKYTKKGY